MGAVRIVEMLFCTSLLCVVGAGDQPELSPRRLKVLNTSNHTCIADLTFVSTILAVKLNRARLVVVEEQRAVARVVCSFMHGGPHLSFRFVFVFVCSLHPT